jgi:hypothetical protein
LSFDPSIIIKTYPHKQNQPTRKLKERVLSDPEFVNLLRNPAIDSQPGGIDSWAS